MREHDFYYFFFFFSFYFQYHLVFRRVFSVGIFVTRFFSLSHYSPLYSRSLSPFLPPLSLFSHKLKLYTIKYLAYITVFRITNPMYIYLFDFFSSSFSVSQSQIPRKRKTKVTVTVVCGRATISFLFGNFSPARCLFRLSWKKKKKIGFQ